MKYEGKLYGKIGNIYFNTGKDSEDWNAMVDALIEANDLINQKYFIREGDSIVLSKIQQALKKAGCTDETL